MTGQVVFGDNYFSRKKDEAKLWRYIERGGHLILLAPRRVGKTSMLRELEKSPKEGYVFLYAMVQSCKTEHEFYKQILEALYDSDFIGNLSKIKKDAAGLIGSALNKIEKINVGDAGITVASSERKITHKDLEKAVNELDLDEKLIIVLDEYPDVLEKINKNKGIEEASEFLSNTRILCQSISFTSKVQFIFTGSIGLDTLASKLNLSHLINDRAKLTISDFSEEKAGEFIQFLMDRNNSPMKLSADVKAYLLKKVEWLMPYYIEILWERLEDHCYDNEIVEPKKLDVDASFEELFSHTYRSNFIHWAERLNRFEPLEKKLIKSLLEKLSKKGQLSFQEFFNLSKLKEYESINANYVIDCLEHDGYIFEVEPKVFQYTSPILREWWSRYADRSL